MKKILALLLCLCLCFVTFSCNKVEESTETKATEIEHSETESTETESVETDQQYKQVEVIIQDNKIYFSQSVASVKVETVTLGYKTTLETNNPLEIKNIVECFEQIELPSSVDITNDSNGGSHYIYFFFEDYTYMVIEPNGTMERTSLIINGKFYNLDSEQYDKINEVLSWRLR